MEKSTYVLNWIKSLAVGVIDFFRLHRAKLSFETRANALSNFEVRIFLEKIYQIFVSNKNRSIDCIIC